MDDAKTKAIIEEMVQDYNAIYKGLAFIKEEMARVRASNGLMVDLADLKDYVKTVKEKFPQLFGEAPAQATAAPAQAPKAEAPAEAPRPPPAEAGQQTIDEAPDSIASPGTKQTAAGPRMATANQIEAIRNFCKTPNLKAIVAETLRTKRLGNVEGLTFDEAFALVGKLHDMRAGRIPPGAKVETGVKA